MYNLTDRYALSDALVLGIVSDLSWANNLECRNGLGSHHSSIVHRLYCRERLLIRLRIKLVA